MPTGTAEIMARLGQKRGRGGSVLVRVPELHPHRILTLPGDLIPGDKGDQIEVELRSEIESTPRGFSALIIPIEEA